MRDYHAADHELQGYLSALRQQSGYAERCPTMYRPPDFQMIPSERDIIRQRMRRREVVTAFGISLGLGIILGVIAALLFIL